MRREGAMSYVSSALNVYASASRMSEDTAGGRGIVRHIGSERDAKSWNRT